MSEKGTTIEEIMVEQAVDAFRGGKEGAKSLFIQLIGRWEAETGPSRLDRINLERRKAALCARIGAYEEACDNIAAACKMAFEEHDENLLAELVKQLERLESVLNK